MLDDETRDWVDLSAIATLIECPADLSGSVYDVAKYVIADAIRQAYNRGLGDAAKAARTAWLDAPYERIADADVADTVCQWAVKRIQEKVVPKP
jgi:hypothetical protein